MVRAVPAYKDDLVLLSLLFITYFAYRLLFCNIFFEYMGTFSEGDFLNAFWAWHDLTSFLLALFAFTTFWSILTSILIRFQWYVEALGMVSLLVEASLGAPQLIRNWQRKSTQGMSIPMVLAWLCGDLAKTGYFVATGSPLQFWVCAILQVSCLVFIKAFVKLFPLLSVFSLFFA
ncbi:PQ loop repeat protein [Oesophagostomum dentatum]|uniref:PQ loop repeat protein n=1 Tax=Oesophagostomum dentatum TaxID=61180 RepID=A0A0B1TNW0_OESDE|nr:PQ loop repeat protein [Oesophagostomum dentatum]